LATVSSVPVSVVVNIEEGKIFCPTRELAENCISMQMPTEPQTVNDFVTTL